jgi:hypothetical protein
MNEELQSSLQNPHCIKQSLQSNAMALIQHFPHNWVCMTHFTAAFRRLTAEAANFITAINCIIKQHS